MKKIGIIGAMELEIKLLLDNMELNNKENISGFSYYSGRILGQDIVVTSCSIGKVNAAACTQILIDRFNVDCIINTGIAGGLHSDVNLCDVVISSDVTYHDVRKSQMKGWFPFKECFESDDKLVEVAIKACDAIKNKEWKYHIGRIVSGECFVADKKLKETIIKEYSPHCVEMEGAAIGHIAHINNVPFLIIRCISDNANDEATLDYETFETIAANQSSNIVLNMINII